MFRYSSDIPNHTTIITHPMFYDPFSVMYNECATLPLAYLSAIKLHGFTISVNPVVVDINALFKIKMVFVHRHIFASAVFVLYQYKFL